MLRHMGRALPTPTFHLGATSQNGPFADPDPCLGWGSDWVPCSEAEQHLDPGDVKGASISKENSSSTQEIETAPTSQARRR